MYVVINDKLSLDAPAGGGALAFSEEFLMPSSDNLVLIEFTVIFVSGDLPALLATLEESDDRENWNAVLSFLVPDVKVITLFGTAGLLAARRYRVRWIFGSAAVPSTAARCILAANVETSHG
jgi:hypothetical protein